MGSLRAVALIFLILWASPALTQEQAILVDKSGSMTLYYQSGLINDLVGKIDSLLRPQGNVQLIAFSDNVRPIRGISELTSVPWGAFTYLDQAIDYVINKKFSIVWMITDNIQDQPGALEAGNTEDFYQKLRGEAVRKVVIFPLAQHPGVPGIVIYAILLSTNGSEQFEKDIPQFLQSVKGNYKTEALRMKPLDKDTVEMSFVGGKLAPGKTTAVYKEGQVIRETLEIRFKSRLDHLKVVDAKLEVPLATTEFAPSSVLSPEKKEIAITPVTVPNLDPQGETEQIYTVSIDLGTIKLKRGLLSLWRAAWGKPREDVTLNLTFLIRVPQNNFKFKETFLQTYNASSLQLAKLTGKVYRIERLPSLLAEETTSIIVESPISFRVEYPWWPAVLFITLSAIGVAILAGAIWAAKQFTLQSGRWTVKAQTEAGATVSSEVTDDKEIVIQGRAVGIIKRNTFLLSDNVTLQDGEEEGEKVSLEDGKQIKIKMGRGGTFILIFSTTKEAEKNNIQHTR